MPAIYHEGGWIGNATDPEVLVKDTVGFTGKNLLKHTQPTKTEAGVTWTYGSNGEVIANGTTGDSVSSFNEPVSLKAGKYIVSGCPANGSISTYCIRIAIGSAALAWEYGNGVEITLSEDSIVYIQSQIRANQTASNLTFYPMLRKADITDPTYEPYHESVEEVIEEDLYGVNYIENKASTQTVNGITFTVNDNKSVRINGTLSASSATFVLQDANEDEILNKLRGKFIFSAGTYVGSSIWVSLRKTDGTHFDIHNASQMEVELTDELHLTGRVHVHVNSNISNVVIAPMLYKAELGSNLPYRPYNYQAIQNQLNAQGVLGAKNLLPKFSSGTDHGITYTVDGDGVVTGNGTASDNNSTIGVKVSLKAGNYILSGCPSGGSTNTYRINAYLSTSPYTNYGNDTGEGLALSFTTDTTIMVQIVVKNGASISNLTFKPMLRLASDPDDTYQPYAMTNRELTEEKINIADLKTVVSASSDFADFKTRIASL